VDDELTESSDTDADVVGIYSTTSAEEPVSGNDVENDILDSE
jgi:hypothetical protein